MLHVGLTGNIASGKSITASFFKELGAHVIDADRVVHELLACGATTYHRIVNAFGTQILDQDGNIDRKKLAQIVFFDEEKRRQLNQLTHPDIREAIQRRISDVEQSLSRGIIIVEAALLVETGGYRTYHRLIVAACDPSLQMSRLMCRDGLTETEAKARMDSQMPIGEKIKIADYVIDTSGTLDKIRDQVADIYRDLLIQEKSLGVSN
jgi:dephospho-CoA kinase